MIFGEVFFEEIREFLLANQTDYGDTFLVGGYIRDALAKRTSRDFDFVLQKNPINAARSVADHFCGAFYVLDKERQIARVLIEKPNGETLYIDFSLMQGEDILSDLEKRDFTINAISLDLKDPHELIDPLGGEADLLNRRLKLCSESSLQLDPVRTIRAVRFIQSFDLTISEDIRWNIKDHSFDLVSISDERVRDEIFKIFSLNKIQGSIELLDDFGLLQNIFPEIPELKNVVPGPPHVHNVFDHIIRVVEITGNLMRFSSFKKDQSSEFFLDQADEVIEPFKPELMEYLEEELTPGRNIASLIHFAALYHDSAKSRINPVFADGKSSYPGHAKMGAEIASSRARSLALSGAEIGFIYRLILNHMKKEFRPSKDIRDKDLWLYRFFRDARETGIAGCFMHLADILATYEQNLTEERWQSALDHVWQIMDAWFNRYDQVVNPEKLISGDDLIERFDLEPGKKIGELLEIIRENQVMGNISNLGQAFEFVENKIRG